MPRIPRVAETAHDRIMASLAGTGSEPAIVEPIDGEAAEPVPVPPAEPDPAGEPDGAGPTNADVRDWARANDVEVSDSGPIPKAVREAYDAAHGG